MSTMSRPWTLEYFEDDRGHSPMERFLDGLPEEKFAALDAALSTILIRHGLSLASTKWLRPLGQGLHEFRARHSEADIAGMYQFAGFPAPSSLHRTPVLIRVFVHFHADHICLLLDGYDKEKDSSTRKQQRQIAKARALLSQFQRRPKGRST
jgi:hypothetical protein